MPLEATLSSAFLVALLGGVHCGGMCGGIVAALGVGMDPGPERIRLLLAYNLGRILSYGLAGALAGAMGALAVELVAMHQTRLLMQALAGSFLVLLGGYLGGWWPLLARVEGLGARLVWSRLRPLGQKLMPARDPLGALLLGAVWGWLPCGLVYSVLIWALATAQPGQGAALMLSFGLGTLPALLAMGLLASQLRGLLQALWLRRLAGLLVAGFGLGHLWMAFRGWS